MRGTEPDRRAADERLAEQVTRHLYAARYRQAAGLLEQLQSESEQQGAELTAQMLDVARGLCLACSQQRATAQWHQEASAQAGEREQELREQLQNLLGLLCERDLSAGSGEWYLVPQPPATELGLRQPGSPQSVEPLSLWQRILGALSWHPVQHAAGEEASDTTIREEMDRAPPLHVQAKELAPLRLLGPEREPSPLPHVEAQEQEVPGAPSLVVYCLGPFWVYQDELAVSEWKSSKGKAIFKYLLAHRDRPVGKEVLMELLWPGADPDAARNNLNVAIYGLRQTLRETRPSFSHILFQDDCYLLNPNLEIWVDSDEFSTRLKKAFDLEQRGKLDAAVGEYQAAEALYRGEFMEEDRYEDWLLPERQRLQIDYLRILDRLSRWYYDQGNYAACGMHCRKMLAVESCCEEAHRRLMRCYHQQGQPYLALRQYDLCVEALREELDVGPTPDTIAVYDSIRHHQHI